MATSERFEDIKAWELARELTRVIYQATKKYTHEQTLIVCRPLLGKRVPRFEAA